MKIKQKDLKLLWGRSGNRCAICREQLTQDKDAVNASFTLGEQAHIVGEKEGAARGNSELTLEERNSYHNLILLCPNHHTIIDKNEDDWPIEKLYMIKSQHELWVTETLSETIDHVKLAEDSIILSIVDSSVTLCCLETWNSWTFSATMSNAWWDYNQVENIRYFKQKVLTAIWPKQYNKLSISAITLAIMLDEAISIFTEHNNFDVHTNKLTEVKFYIKSGSNPNYERDVKLYQDWKSRCYQAILNATKAANWFADVIREDINPMFFVEKGRFFVGDEPDHWENYSEATRAVEFTEEEKAYFFEKYQ